MQDITQTNEDFTAEIEAARRAGEAMAAERQREGGAFLSTTVGYEDSPGTPNG